MKAILWDSLVSGLQTGQCVLVLGPDVPAGPPDGAGGEPAAESVRDLFCTTLAQQLEEEGQDVGERVLFAVAQQFEDFGGFPSNTLRNIAAGFFREPGRGPGAQHRALAGLPFSTVLTTCHDDLFEQACRDLEADPKEPVSRHYHFRGEQRDIAELPLSADPAKPVVYHLFGTFERPDSLVLTENDLLDFVIRVISARPGLPDSLRSALRNKTFLFVGFGIRHWYIRVLLKLLVRTLELSGGSVALESLGGLDDRERRQTVLFYKRGTRIEVVDMDADAFVTELQQRLDKVGGYRAGATAPLRRAQVFISYERGDEAVARRLFGALPREKIDACLDADFLGAGELWNETIEQKIGASHYFLVLNSENLRGKDVGYVNKELALALERQKYRAPGVPFIVPIGVDGLSAEQGRHDLKPFHQLPLRRDSFHDDAAEITRHLWRDFQKRSRDATA